MADEGGAQEAVQGCGCPPLCVLQSRWDGVHRGIDYRTPAASGKGRWERLGTDKGGGMVGEGKLGRQVGGRGRGQVGGSGGGSGPVARRADAAGGKRLQDQDRAGKRQRKLD